MSEGKIRKIPLEERRTTFKEVSSGFTQEEALKEAERCLQCPSPLCKEGCPVGIDIKEFIRLISKKEYGNALKEIKKKNSLPAICGRVCPQEDQCQKSCILNKKGSPIKIGYLERFVADWGIGFKEVVPQVSEKKEIKVGIIGSGPAGLTCSAELARQGFRVYLFEALHKPGGVLVYGIPEFRLPKLIVEKEVEYIKKLGVQVYTNFIVGKTATIQELRKEGFSAFFIGVGAGLPLFLNIEGENLGGVYSANEFLTRINLMKAYLFPEYETPIAIGEKVGVIGGGNVAFDCARSALRSGAKEVSIIYRRTEEEMPARVEEIENAKEEGVRFHLLTSPLKIESLDGYSIGRLICRKNELGEPDSSGRRRPVPISGSEFEIPLDTLVIAIGTGPNPLLLSTLPELELTPRGYIKVNEKLQTSLPYIFAGGDIVTGSATVISAMAQGKKAASSIKEFFS